jgi:undecaprenyl-diphosphatase
MTPWQAAVLGAVQGLTEFLPISSSAHLVLVPRFLGWRYEGVAFDVALHGGTLIALLVVYGRDFWGMLTSLAAPSPGERADARRLWLWLIVATVPGAIVGKLLEARVEDRVREMPVLLAALLATFGFVLWAVDRAKPPGRDVKVPGWSAAVWMGLAQALALVPGVSRSGITITAGRAVGLSRVSAARFSFLLATPITFGAVLLKARHMPMDVAPLALVTGVVTSAVVGVLAIRGLIHWLGRAGFGVFFAYRLVLAAVILLALVRQP